MNTPSTETPKGTTRITRTCLSCKKDISIWVPLDGFRKWQHGELIQNAMPNVPAGDRELLISGFCSTCFDNLFGES